MCGRAADLKCVLDGALQIVMWLLSGGQHSVHYEQYSVSTEMTIQYGFARGKMLVWRKGASLHCHRPRHVCHAALVPSQNLLAASLTSISSLVVLQLSSRAFIFSLNQALVRLATPRHCNNTVRVVAFNHPLSVARGRADFPASPAEKRIVKSRAQHLTSPSLRRCQSP